MLKTWTDRAWNEYVEWQTRDKKIAHKINSLIKSIDRDGAVYGEGKPELLKGNYSGFISRRINGEHRLIYRVGEDTIVIISCSGHYELSDL